LRYYKIKIVDPSTGKVLVPSNSSNTGFSLSSDPNASTWTSLNPNATVFTIGGSNPAAQRLEVDITTANMHYPVAKAAPYIKIYGVPLAQINQASYLNGKFISIEAGMSKGLPLANPQQTGLLASGQILKSFGNWIGTEQSLSMYIIAGGSATAYSQAAGGAAAPIPVTNDTPANLVFNWQQGQPIMQAIATTLSTAFPQLSVAGEVNANLVWNSGAAKVGYFQTLQQFAQFINEVSISIVAGPTPANNVYGQAQNPTYSGIAITLQGGTLLVSDGTTQTNPKNIAFQDMIGQPVWNDKNTVQLTTVLRSDIQVSDFIKLPPAQGTITGGAPAQAGTNPFASTQKDGSIFNGVFLVRSVRHVGDSRNPAGTAWCTLLELLFQNASPAPVASLPFVYKSTSGNAFGFTSP
jgi:hypothetical protein